MALDTFNPYLFVSSGEQSNKFLTPTYADGIAKFQAQRAQSLTGLTVRIEGVQEGTGDPSPTNIRPISGRTGLTVTRAGKNLANFVDGKGIGTTGYVTDHKERSATVDPIFVCNGVSYKFVSVNNTATCIYSVFNENTLVRRVADVLSGRTLNTSGGDKLYVCGYSSAHVTAASAELMVVADTIPTVYEPYAGQTYPISWQTEAGTVYGGTLDVVSGVLTVTHGYILLDGSQDIRSNGRTTVTQRAIVYIVGKASGTTNIQSDRFAVTSVRDAVGKVNGRPASNGVEFYLPLDGTEDTNASCKQWFSNNNTQLVYELATPQTYRLTGAEVRTIAGYNQIYSDAGPVIDIKF